MLTHIDLGRPARGRGGDGSRGERFYYIQGRTVLDPMKMRMNKKMKTYLISRDEQDDDDQDEDEAKEDVPDFS